MSAKQTNTSGEKLESSEKLFRAMVENGFDAIAIVNAEIQPTYISPSGLNITGYSEEEVLKFDSLLTIHPDDISYIQNKLADVFQNPGVAIRNLNYRFKHKDGYWMWVEASITNFLEDPIIKGILINFRDITERKLMEIQLTNITDNVNGIVFRYLLDVDGKDRLLYLNKTSSKVWGVEAKDAMEDTSLIWNKIYPDDIPDMLQSIKKSAETLEEWSWEWRYIHPDGSLRWQKGSGTPQRNADGSTIWDSIIIDITAFKAAESKLKEMNKNLSNQSEELETLNKELEQFAYVASHDLQEPLRMISSFLKQLENKYSQSLDEMAQKYIYYAVDGANRMKEIINDLLEFSRVGKTAENTELIDLDEFLLEIESLFRKEIEDKKATIEIRKMPRVMSIKTPLRQVFHNLIGNALKYSKKEIPVKIDIESRDLESHWQFSVKDNGIGIPKDSQDKVFEIFQRLHTKEQYEGTGIGLAITKKIIESMDGDIWVESEPGIGSTFFITLPKGI